VRFVIIDATQPFEKQDLTIADLVARERPRDHIRRKQWDLIDRKAGAIGVLRRQA